MMIEVNLLPSELRRIERTPLPRFLVIILGTAAVMATGAFGVVVNLRNVPDLEAKQSAVENDIRDGNVSAAAWDKLQEEIGDAQARKQAIAELWRTRILWSKKLAQLSQMVPPFVGFTEVRLEENHGGGFGGQDCSGMLTLESLISGADLDRVAQWRRTVEGNKPFFSSFLDLLPTETTRVGVREDTFVEKEALRVAIKMPIKTTAARMAEAMQALQDEINRGQGTTTVPTGLPMAPDVPATPAAPSAPAPKPAGDVKKEPASVTPASLDVTPAAVVPPARNAN